MVQQAVAQILTPIFERVSLIIVLVSVPTVGPMTLLQKVVDLYNQGYRRVVDLRPKSLF